MIIQINSPDLHFIFIFCVIYILKEDPVNAFNMHLIWTFKVRY